MKKILLVFAAIFALAACTAPAPMPVNSNSNANAAKPVVMLTEADATAKEKAAWEAIQKKDFNGFADMLASDAVEVSPTAVNDKAATIAGVKDFEPTEVVFSDWKFLPLDNDAFVIAYMVKVKGKYQGKEFPQESARASSAWINRDGKWVSVYHQECPVTTTPPPPMPAVKATPSAGNSPAAPPATPTTGPDPEANEKTVWDLFKSKNYDGFASLLADDFIEIESNGVYDKAAAVKSAQFDASKTELSDWKTLRIDADAALVTYLVKIPGLKGMSALGERHTTIWTSRNGKWLARFHHGTPVVPAPPAPSPKPTPATSASPTSSASPK